MTFAGWIPIGTVRGLGSRLATAYSVGMYARPEELVELRKLYPGLADEQLDEIQINFERYVEFAVRILDRETDQQDSRQP